MRLPWLAASSDAPFPPIERACLQPNGLLAAGGDLNVARLVRAYRQGIFPWFMPGEPILWWSPDPRCVFHTERMHVARRLRRWLAASTWVVSADRDFAAVVAGCAAPRDQRGGTWISAEMGVAYQALHAAGCGHSIEVRDGERLIGGLYGVAIGRMFYAESMYSGESHASKVALLALAATLRAWGWPLVDAQVSSPHLHTLGAELMPRPVFLRQLAALVDDGPAPGSWHERFGNRLVAGL
jgi:leucyl/phenylalanyl-tRNA--protein transferase